MGRSGQSVERRRHRDLPSRVGHRGRAAPRHVSANAALAALPPVTPHAALGQPSPRGSAARLESNGGCTPTVSRTSK